MIPRSDKSTSKSKDDKHKTASRSQDGMNTIPERFFQLAPDVPVTPRKGEPSKLSINLSTTGKNSNKPSSKPSSTESSQSPRKILGNLRRSSLSDSPKSSESVESMDFSQSQSPRSRSTSTSHKSLDHNSKSAFHKTLDLNSRSGSASPVSSDPSPHTSPHLLSPNNIVRKSRAGSITTFNTPLKSDMYSYQRIFTGSLLTHDTILSMPISRMKKLEKKSIEEFTKVFGERDASLYVRFNEKNEIISAENDKSDDVLVIKKDGLITAYLLDKQCVLGKGDSGTVIIAYRLPNHVQRKAMINYYSFLKENVVAVKLFKVKLIGQNKDGMIDKLSRTGTDMFIGHCITPGANAKSVILMKFVDGYNLDEFLNVIDKSKSLEDKERIVGKRYIKPEDKTNLVDQVVTRLNIFHVYGEMIHNDLKCGNFMASSSNIPCLSHIGKFKGDIIDLDDAIDKSIKTTGSCRTLGYNAPEVTNSPKAIVTQKTDRWAAGVMMSNIISGKSYQKQCILKTVRDRIKGNNTEILQEELYQLFPDVFGESNLYSTPILPQIGAEIENLSFITPKGLFQVIDGKYKCILDANSLKEMNFHYLLSISKEQAKEMQFINRCFPFSQLLDIENAALANKGNTVMNLTPGQLDEIEETFGFKTDGEELKKSNICSMATLPLVTHGSENLSIITQEGLFQVKQGKFKRILDTKQLIHIHESYLALTLSDKPASMQAHKSGNKKIFINKLSAEKLKELDAAVLAKQGHSIREDNMLCMMTHLPPVGTESENLSIITSDGLYQLDHYNQKYKRILDMNNLNRLKLLHLMLAEQPMLLESKMLADRKTVVKLKSEELAALDLVVISNLGRSIREENSLCIMATLPPEGQLDDNLSIITREGLFQNIKGKYRCIIDANSLDKLNLYHLVTQAEELANTKIFVMDYLQNGELEVLDQEAISKQGNSIFKKYAICIMPQLPKVNAVSKNISIITKDGLFQLIKVKHDYEYQCIISVAELKRMGMGLSVESAKKLMEEKVSLKDELTPEQFAELDSMVVSKGGHPLKHKFLSEQFEQDGISETWIQLPIKELFQYILPYLEDITEDDLKILKRNPTDVIDEVVYQLHVFPKLVNICKSYTQFDPAKRPGETEINAISKELINLQIEYFEMSRHFNILCAEYRNFESMQLRDNTSDHKVQNANKEQNSLFRHERHLKSQRDGLSRNFAMLFGNSVASSDDKDKEHVKSPEDVLSDSFATLFGNSNSKSEDTKFREVLKSRKLSVS